MKTTKTRLCWMAVLVLALGFCLSGCGKDDPSSTLASSANFHTGAVGDYMTDSNAGATAIIAGQPLHYIFDAGSIVLDLVIPVASHLTVTVSPMEVAWRPDESPVVAGSEAISDTGPILVFEDVMEAGLYMLPIHADYLPSGCYRFVIAATSSHGTITLVRNALLVHSFEEIPGDLLWLYYYTLCQTRGYC